MKILVAPDSFKDCLSARQVAVALSKGMKKISPETIFDIAPMADGGEGTVESVVDATQGKLVQIPVMDPLMRETSSFYGITGDGTTAVIEMAAASGIELLVTSERNPWVTSTFGTGQLIRHALDRGCKKILLGIGGSATNDGGAGMAVALGVKFTNHAGASIGPGGGALIDVAGVHMDGLDPRIANAEILVACDVSNPLTGPNGASFVYGPQKGADQEMVEKLDKNLNHFAGVIQQQLGKEISHLPGAGAAGGLGAGLMAFLGARLMKGFDMIAETVGLEEKIKRADLVITGEGKIDGQTRFGKTPFGVAQLAQKHGKPVVGVAGTVEAGADLLYREGFHLIMPIMEMPSDLAYAITHAEQLLERTGERIARMLNLEI
ncbi:MAG: glycerate kinase [Bacteroidales bacterium]|nr:glycerate kinase [Bacteroidales bacterium]